MTRETLDKLRAMGMNLGPQYDILADTLTRNRLETEETNKKIEEAKTKRNEQEQLNNNGQVKTKKDINLAIVLEPEGKEQFERTLNDVWDVRYIQSFSDIDNIRDWNNRFNYKNICLVHHGNTFSYHKLKDDEKVVLSPNRFKLIKNVISKLSEPKEITDEYISKVFKKSYETYQNGLPINEINSFFSLKLLIGQLLDNGCFFSIACNEADNPDFLLELSEFTAKNVKLFASSNYATIDDQGEITYQSSSFNIKVSKSILNSYLTDSKWWKDLSGWKYYDSKLKKIIITKKDLWLYSNNKSKIYELLSRKKILTKIQINEEDQAQLLFSKKFKTEYIKKFKEPAYKNYKKQTESTYPRLKT